jgi:lipoprotein-releasing system permease protein
VKFSFFIARRFSGFFSEKGVKKPPGIKISIFGIAAGTAVILLAFAVVVGFKNEVSNRVTGFGAHIQIMAFNSGLSFEKTPISISEKTQNDILNINNVKKIEKIITKSGIVKTENSFQGVVFKGVDSNYCWDFLEKNLVEGEIINFKKPENQNKVLISKYLADALMLKTGDALNAYFFEQQVRARKFEIAGVYSTSFSEFDKLFVICNLIPVRILNNWDSTQISTLEIMLHDFEKLNETAANINFLVGNKFSDDGFLYNTLTIKEIYPQIFNWLDMLDLNAWIILILMITVAGFNMISGLLILILERTQTIGILKALGTKNSEIRKIFLIHALFFVFKGMFWGNVFGIGLAAIQYHTHVINFLNPEYYYVTFVPVSLNFWTVLLINAGVFAAAISMMLLPSHIITKISPAKSIKFE